MANEVHATPSQIDAAKMIVARDSARGRETPEAIRKLAEAEGGQGMSVMDLLPPPGRSASTAEPVQARQASEPVRPRQVTQSPTRLWAVVLVVSLGTFITTLDLTAVNIAIPNMITTLHASLDDILWVINAYALVLAVLLIITRRLGDLIGPRIMFVGGVAVFTVASAACGAAPSPGWLIAFRAVQGLGAAMLIADGRNHQQHLPGRPAWQSFGRVGPGRDRGHDRRTDARRAAGHRVRLAVDLLR